jgi:hypothetical protein
MLRDESTLLEHKAVERVDGPESNRPTAFIRPYGNASFFGEVQRSDEWTTGNVGVRGDGSPTEPTLLAVHLKRCS